MRLFKLKKWLVFLLLLPSFLAAEDKVQRSMPRAEVLFGPEFRDVVVSMVLHQSKDELVEQIQMRLQDLNGKPLRYGAVLEPFQPFREILDAEEEKIFKTLKELRDEKHRLLEEEFSELDAKYNEVLERTKSLNSLTQSIERRVLERQLFFLDLKRRENRIEYQQATRLLETWRDQFDRLKTLEVSLNAELEITPVLERGELDFSQDHAGRSQRHLVDASLGLDVEVEARLIKLDARFEEIVDGERRTTPIPLTPPPDSAIDLEVYREDEKVQPHIRVEASAHEDLTNPEQSVQIALESIQINEEEDRLALSEEGVSSILDWMLSKENIENTVGAFYSTTVMQDLVQSVGREVVSSLKRRKFPLVFWMYTNDDGEIRTNFGFRNENSEATVAALKEEGRLVMSAEGDMPLFVEDFTLDYNRGTQTLGVSVEPPEFVQVNFQASHLAVNESLLKRVDNEEVKRLLQPFVGNDLSTSDLKLKTQVRLPKDKIARFDIPLLFQDSGVYIDSQNLQVDFDLLNESYFSAFELDFGEDYDSIFIDPQSKDEELLDQGFSQVSKGLSWLRRNPSSKEAHQKAEEELQDLILEKVEASVLNLGGDEENPSPKGVFINQEGAQLHLKVHDFEFAEDALDCDLFESDSKKIKCRLVLPQTIGITLQDVRTEDGNRVDKIESTLKADEPQVIDLEFNQDPKTGEIFIDKSSLTILRIINRYEVNKVEVDGEVFGSDLKGIGAHLVQQAARKVGNAGVNAALQDGDTNLSLLEKLSLAVGIGGHQVAREVQGLEEGEAAKEFKKVLELQRVKLAAALRKELAEQIDGNVEKVDSQMRDFFSDIFVNRIPVKTHFGGFRLNGEGPTLKEKANAAATRIIAATFEGQEGGLGAANWPQFLTNQELVKLFRQQIPETVTEKINESFSKSKASYSQRLLYFMKNPSEFAAEDLPPVDEILSQEASQKVLAVLKNPLEDEEEQALEETEFEIPELQSLCIYDTEEGGDRVGDQLYSLFLMSPYEGRPETEDSGLYDPIGGKGRPWIGNPSLDRTPTVLLKEDESAIALFPFMQMDELMWKNIFYIEDTIRQRIKFDEDGKPRKGIQSDIHVSFEPGDWESPKMFRVDDKGRAVARFALSISQNDQTIVQDSVPIPIVREVVGGLVDFAGRPLLQVDTKGKYYIEIPVEFGMENIENEDGELIGYNLTAEAQDFSYLAKDRDGQNTGTRAALRQIADTVSPKDEEADPLKIEQKLEIPMGLPDLPGRAEFGVKRVGVVYDEFGRAALGVQFVPSHVDEKYLRVPKDIPIEFESP